jgi:hypothetical protein
VLSRLSEAAPESSELGGTQPLVAEHQHRMLGEGLLCPGEGRIVERLRQVDAERLGAECFAERA